MSDGKTVRPIRRDELRKFKNVVIVFGSRKFKDRETFDACVDGFVKDNHMTREDTVFVSGMAQGPDLFIVEYAKQYGWRWHECPADWKNLDAPIVSIKDGPYGRYNALAGFQRNQEMANVGSHGLGFWDGKTSGTRDMVDRCNEKKLIVRIIRIKDE